MKTKSNTDDFIRGSAASIILYVLTKGPKHGYGITRAIEDESRGRLLLGEATVYPTLKILEREGLVKSEWICPEGGARKKVYEITDEGRQSIVKKRAAYEVFARDFLAFIGGQLDDATA